MLESGWWGYGKECKKLENKFTQNNPGWAIATSSGTSALSIIANLIKYRYGTGSEIIIPAITWISTAAAFLKEGLKIRLAEVSPNLLIDIESVEKTINKNTKAIVLVHLYGQKVDVDTFKTLADKYNLILIEDRAHLVDLNSKIISDYCAFSFNVLKELPSGEGGLVWGRNMEEEPVAQNFSYLGLNQNTFLRASKQKHNDIIFSENTGLKLQSNDISAALTNFMISKMTYLYKKREKIFACFA